MGICAVFDCNSNSDKRLKRNADEQVRQSIHYFRFPKDKHLSKIWIGKCGRKDQLNLTNARICSKHFTSEHYVRNLKHELLNYTPKCGRRLKDDAIPTENLPNTPSSSALQRIEKKKLLNAARVARIEKRKSKQIVKELLAASDNSKSEFKESTNLDSEVRVPDKPASEHIETYELSADPQEPDKLASEVGEAGHLASDRGEADQLAPELGEADKLIADLKELEKSAFELEEAENLPSELRESDTFISEPGESDSDSLSSDDVAPPIYVSRKQYADKRLKDDAISTENLPNKPSSSALQKNEKKNLLNDARVARIEKRKSKQIVKDSSPIVFLFSAASDNTKSESLQIKESGNLGSEVRVPDEQPVSEHRKTHELSADHQEPDKLASEVREAGQLASERAEAVSLSSDDVAPPISVSRTIYADKATSIESLYVSTVASELLKLRFELKKLKQRNDFLKKENNYIKDMFSPGQRQKMQNKRMRIRWTAIEINNALKIFAKGPKVYRILLKKRFPLPSISTLRFWSEKQRQFLININ